MNKKTFRIVASSIIMLCAIVLMSAKSSDDIISKSNGMSVVNTQLLAKDVRGYRGNTPVKIYIKKNKVVKIEAMPNQETPKFFARAKNVLTKYNGKATSKAETMKVDGVTGATFSSKALIKNVQAGLAYYNDHK
jgi:uncharacterized protein with FMN-binding domain